jgi:pyrroline-5-carboxylate reductase
MLKGSLTLLEGSEKHPGELKWQITSPAGTTIEGLKTFEDYAVRSGIMHTFLASFNKIKQLSAVSSENAE